MPQYASENDGRVLNLHCLKNDPKKDHKMNSVIFWFFNNTDGYGQLLGEAFTVFRITTVDEMETQDKR